MATRNERKRLAKAKHKTLLVSVDNAFKQEQERQAIVSARHGALVAVNQWTRKGTHCICHPGLGFNT